MLFLCFEIVQKYRKVTEKYVHILIDSVCFCAFLFKYLSGAIWEAVRDRDLELMELCLASLGHHLDQNHLNKAVIFCLKLTL